MNTFRGTSFVETISPISTLKLNKKTATGVNSEN